MAFYVTFHGVAGQDMIPWPMRILLEGDDPESSSLLDCGDIVPDKEKKLTYKPSFEHIDPHKVKVVLPSHSHTDHVGALCGFVEQGFGGEIISTEPTKPVTEATFINNHDEHLVDPVFELWGTPKRYLERFQIADGVYVTFYPATGHILGAASILIELEKENLRILYSGDLGNTNKTMLETSGEVPEADIVIMESTYGDREHHPNFNKTLEQLYKEINKTYDKGGNCYIPVLSINKLQEALYYVNLAIENGQIPSDVNVVVDTALGEAVTAIYSEYAKDPDSPYFSDEAKTFFGAYSKVHPFNYNSRFDIEPNGRNIILSTSGLDGLMGTFAKRYLKELSSSKNSVAVISHTIPGSPLDQIVSGKEKVAVNGKSVELKAKTLDLYGFSSHADATQLLNWLVKTKAKYVFLVHGEEDSRAKLKEMIATRGICSRERIFTPALQEKHDLTALPGASNSSSIIVPEEKPLVTPEPPKLILFGQEVKTAKKL